MQRLRILVYINDFREYNTELLMFKKAIDPPPIQCIAHF